MKTITKFNKPAPEKRGQQQVTVKHMKDKRSGKNYFETLMELYEHNKSAVSHGAQPQPSIAADAEVAAPVQQPNIATDAIIQLLMTVLAIAQRLQVLARA